MRDDAYSAVRRFQTRPYDTVRPSIFGAICMPVTTGATAHENGHRLTLVGTGLRQHIGRVSVMSVSGSSAALGMTFSGSYDTVRSPIFGAICMPVATGATAHENEHRLTLAGTGLRQHIGRVSVMSVSGSSAALGMTGGCARNDIFGVLRHCETANFLNSDNRRAPPVFRGRMFRFG